MSSDAEHPWLGCLGLVLLVLGLRGAVQHRVDAAELARFYQAGFAHNAVALLPLTPVSPVEREVLQRRLERAVAVSAHNPLRLRAVPPYPLGDDGRYWPATSDLAPPARWRLRRSGSENAKLHIALHGQAPTAPFETRSERLVMPDWSPFSRLVAYYDLGRVFISDLEGLHMQSLVQVPELEQGGQLRFSADGTALAFYYRGAQRWTAQDIYVLVERP